MFRKSNYFERNDSWLKIILIYGMLILGCCITIYPILNVFSVSMRPGSSLYSTSLDIFPDIDKLRWTGIVSSEDGTNMAAAAKRSFIFTSKDQGKTWIEQTELKVGRTTIAGDLNWESIDMSADGRTIVVSEEGKRTTDKGSLIVSTDAGRTWKAARNVDAKWQKVAVSGDGKQAYAIAKRRNSFYLFHSEEGFSSWSELASAEQKDWMSISSSFDGSKVIAVAKDDYIYMSGDFGQKWSPIRNLPKASWIAVRMNADASTIAAAADNDFLYISRDGGRSWKADDSIGKNIWNSISLSGSRIGVALKEDLIYSSSDLGLTWTKYSFGKNIVTGSVAVAPGLSKTIAAADLGYIYRIDAVSAEKIRGYTRKVHYLDNYVKAFTKYDVLKWLKNSFIVALLSTVMGVLLAITAGYAFSRYVFKGREVGLSMLFVTQMFPITMLLIPLYLMLSKLGLINGYAGLIIIYTATAIPFNIWMIKGYFDTIPKSLEESAYLDGCTPWQAFYLIMLPLARPAIALCALFSFMGSWSEYLVANAVLKNANLKTLPIGLVSLQGEFTTEWGVYSAIALVTAVPVMIIFISLSKYLVGGLSSGAVKG